MKRETNGSSAICGESMEVRTRVAEPLTPDDYE